MLVHVLLFEAGNDNEGIHSLEIKDKTVVLMFEEKDDAERYCGLLEAQDFPCPTVEVVEREEIESFCKEAGYESRFVNSGFIPESQEDRLLISPPESNLDVTDWQKKSIINNQSADQDNSMNNDLDHYRRSLEDLL
tara:strand:- start:74 stop:481 length:408 start_codon:yes stop_codon:yes gene_type:complete